ncbi:MAG: hypothetical protein KAI24_15945 [Planctomycetes bacterium]|nr:hypothetical protein [Planctomycetota bacterium]
MVLPLLAMAFASCETATNLMFEPEPNDPLDGYEGSLAQAGINTDMDWGPKQNLLLSKYKTLLEENARLEKDNQALLAQNQNLQSQLSNEQSTLEQEQGMRAQSEAETDLLRQKIRDRDAKILSLSIEKARLEQERLQLQIAALSDSMEQGGNPTEAAAKPSRRP